MKKYFNFLLCSLFIQGSGMAANFNLQNFDQGVVNFDKDTMRPFRVGYIKLNAELDKDIPMGIADFAGWVAVSGKIIGSVDKKRIVAFNEKDGNPDWVLNAEVDVTAPILNVGTAVVAGTRDGTVYKIDAATGKVIWKAELDTFVSRKMLLQGSTVFAVSASQHIYSLDLQSGKINWLYDGGFPANLSVRTVAAPVIFNGSVYFGVSTGEIVAVNADSGALVWRFNPEFNESKFFEYVGEMVVVGNRLVFSRYDGLVGALNLQGAQSLAWSHKLPNVAISSFRGGRFFVGLVNGEVSAFDATTGNSLWKTKVAETASDITAGERHIYVSGSSGSVSLLNSDGKIQWVDFLEGRIASPAFYIGSDIFYATGAKNLYGYKIN